MHLMEAVYYPNLAGQLSLVGHDLDHVAAEPSLRQMG